MIDLITIKRTSLLQHDTSDCGAACLVSAINYFGGSSTIENIRNSSGTDQSGTTMLGLYQAALNNGLDASGYEAEISDIINYDGLLIIHVKLDSGLEHYILSFGYQNEKFVLWDPAKGIVFLSSSDLEKIWVSKKCLGLKPNDGFVLKKGRNHSSLKWIKEKVKPDGNILFASFLTGILISVLSMVMAVFTQKLIDNILPSKNLSHLSLSLILLFILLLTKIGLGYIRQLMLLTQGRNFNIRVIDDFFGLLLSLPRTFFDTRRKGDFIGRLNDTMRIQRVITEFVSIYLIDILVVLISVCLLFFYSFGSALITVLFLPFLFSLVYGWNRKIISSQRDAMVAYASTESNYIDTLGGVTEIKSLNWKEYFKKKNKAIFSDFQEKSLNLGRIKVSLGLIAGFSGVSYLIVILLISSLQVFNSKISSGELLAILSICSGILPSVLNLALISIPVSEAKVALSRMTEFTDIKPEFDKDDHIYEVKSIDSISVRDVSFRFPGRSLLINKINMQLRKGSLISLTGESGGGKSTFAGIILRFHDPESGGIFVNDIIDAKGINIENWRSRIIIIPQEIHIFNGTILQNILPEQTEENFRDLVLMINEYGLVRFFDSFPAGLLTQVGEDGISLSGGQKQVIAFIRALFKKPDFLIIDEGTSNLDRNTEEILLNILRMIKSRIGILMITHKRDLAREISDELYTLEGGVINYSSENTQVFATI